LNNDIKSNAVGRKRAKDLEEMEKNIRGFLMRKQRNKESVKKYFQEKHVKYAAA